MPAAAIVAPGLADERRALTRRLGRPIGLSGSGPTLWTLYPSLGEAETAARDVEAAVGEGMVPTIGDGPPSIIATTIRTGTRPEGGTT
jgi:4-diphosphocytidyl-2C-methyl-D-erythritol kinase